MSRDAAISFDYPTLALCVALSTLTSRVAATRRSAASSDLIAANSRWSRTAGMQASCRHTASRRWRVNVRTSTEQGCVHIEASLPAPASGDDHRTEVTR